MTNRNTENDSWGELLSNFGIEDNTPKEPTQPEQATVMSGARMPETELPESAEADSFGTEATSKAASAEKKSIFSRFPKMPFFGAPPEVSLDSVIEGAKSPSLGGKAFTDNTLEKMPVSQERKDRHKIDDNVADSRKPNVWSTVASQIDTLASGKEVEEKRPARREVTSMFDDPIPEPEELRACKNLMGETSRREEADFQQRGRGRRQSHRETQPHRETQSHRETHRELQPEERETRGRGARFRAPIEVDDLSSSDFADSDFEAVDDLPVTTHEPSRRGRGGRGSRYPAGDSGSDSGYRGRKTVHDDAPQEEWSEVDAALQSGRGGRHQRHDKRQKPDRRDRQPIEREAFDSEDNFDSGGTAAVAYHGSVPSWDEAIGDIISGNISRRRSQPAHSGRGRR